MELPLGLRLRHAWDVFRNRDPTSLRMDLGPSSYYRPDRQPVSFGNEMSIIGPIINQISVDASQISIRHVRLDDQKRYIEDIDSTLNECFRTAANIDQTGRAFIHDVVHSMLDEGVVAVVPTVTEDKPTEQNAFSIIEMRVGKITAWYPEYVKVELYNVKTGQREPVTLPKKMVAIIENPFYSVMNAHNSIVKRLVNKMNLLDVADSQSVSEKLNMLIQLPYAINTERRKEQAETRLKALEDQLTTSKYGIGYIDATERITQINRGIENNLLSQIEYLTKMLYSQLGVTQEIMDGTASEEVMLNYYNRTIEPIVSAITEEMERKFLTKTARSRGQAIMYFREPFRLTPVEKLAESVNAFIRNEVITANEFRQIIGMKPSGEPKSDELRNPNIKQPNDVGAQAAQVPDQVAQMSEEEILSMIEQFDKDDAELDALEKELDAL